jgi:hypothetical protein
MQEKIRIIVLCIIAFIFELIAGYFFYSTGIKINMVETLNLEPLTKAILTINFGLFLLSTSIALATALIVARKMDKKTGITAITITYFSGAIITIIIFQQIEFILTAFMTGIGLAVALFTLKEKEKELKYFQKIRAGISAGHKILLFSSLGILFTILITTIPANQEIKQNFVDDFLKITFGEGITVEDFFTQQIAEQFIASETQLLDQVSSFSELKKMEQKNDEDAILFKQKLLALRANINSEETKKILAEKLKSADISPAKSVLTQMPVFEAVSSIAWALYAVIGFGTASFIGNIVIVNLAALIYAGALFFFPKEEMETTERKQKQ